MINEIKGHKGGGGGGHTPVESPDSIQSMAIAKILLALGEGELAGGLKGTNIFLDGTPLTNEDGSSNFEGVSWEFRPGTQSQEYIKGVPAVENEITIGTELKSSAPWVRAVNNTQLSAVRLRFGWPALQQQKDNGDVNGYKIEYAIDVAKRQHFMSAATVLTYPQRQPAGSCVFAVSPPMLIAVVLLIR